MKIVVDANYFQRNNTFALFAGKLRKRKNDKMEFNILFYILFGLPFLLVFAVEKLFAFQYRNNCTQQLQFQLFLLLNIFFTTKKSVFN